MESTFGKDAKAGSSYTVIFFFIAAVPRMGMSCMAYLFIFKPVQMNQNLAL